MAITAIKLCQTTEHRANSHQRCCRKKQILSRAIQDNYQLKAVHTVPVPDNASEADALERVATFAGAHLNTLVLPGTTLGVAWGTTLAAISRHLIPQPTPNVAIVQLNGSGNTANISNLHISEVILQLAQNYGAKAHLFPVPAFFDYPQTKTALWRERSVKQTIDLQHQADVLLYSVGALHAEVPSYVYAAGYLEDQDVAELTRQGVVGDIATVFFRADGSFKNIPINRRASGPDLSPCRRVTHAVCVIAGRSKLEALKGALAGGLLNQLIVDEPTARLLLE
ncbi:sugar-binding transcriptional regulator [Meiothermus granaticius]|uniref:sugar-binding transcriptional regulator n=1 Tax=Meiothermus granaticius TaxID=863370 RepID=UPI00147400FD|nr:sugar-binding domain-containing protein [Meiothermus granaticius]